MTTETYPDGTPLFPGDSLEDNPPGGWRFDVTLRDRDTGASFVVPIDTAWHSHAAELATMQAIAERGKPATAYAVDGVKERGA